MQYFALVVWQPEAVKNSRCLADVFNPFRPRIIGHSTASHGHGNDVGRDDMKNASGIFQKPRQGKSNGSKPT